MSLTCKDKRKSYFWMEARSRVPILAIIVGVSHCGSDTTENGVHENMFSLTSQNVPIWVMSWKSEIPGIWKLLVSKPIATVYIGSLRSQIDDSNTRINPSEGKGPSSTVLTPVWKPSVAETTRARVSKRRDNSLTVMICHIRDNASS